MKIDLEKLLSLPKQKRQHEQYTIKCNDYKTHIEVSIVDTNRSYEIFRYDIWKFEDGEHILNLEIADINEWNKFWEGTNNEKS